MALQIRDAKHIFQRLREGAVPTRGLEAFAVGIERQRKELGRKLDELHDGEGGVKFLRGGYGCGKTFMANLLLQDAQAKNFATSFVVVSDNDLHFHKFDELYRKVVGGLSTPACPQGALGDILDRWIGSIEENIIELGTPESDPKFEEKVHAKLDEQLKSMTGESAPADMIRVVRKIFDLKQRGQLQDAAGLTSWLAGSTNVANSIKALASIKGEIESDNALAYLRGILAIVRSAQYDGLVIVIDEAETILRMRGDVRSKSLNAIRQIVDESAKFAGLLWVFTGTPTFFDDRHGVRGLEPLHARVRFEKFQDVASARQPQLELEPFNEDRLRRVAIRLRSLYPDFSPDEAEKRMPNDVIEQLVKKVTEGFHGDVGVVPRQFLRTFVGILDLLSEFPDREAHALLGFQPQPANLTPQEEARLAGRPLDESPPDDGFGGAAIDL